MLAQITNLIDPDKVSIDGTDDADPHVIALALTDAAGIFGIGCVRFRTFLISEGIWDGREGT